MGFDELKDRFERLMAEYTRPLGARDQASAMHAVLVDLKVGLKDLRHALSVSERELVREQEELATAERRRRLASEIDDGETVELAQVFVAKHQERIDILIRKLSAQQDELAVAEREYQDLSDRYRAAKLGVPPNDGPRPAVSASPEDDLHWAESERRADQATVDAQLEALKKKMGRD
ncbi:MAG: hypothetical protein AB7R55_10780 [Gemmatimonadales bacterium]